MIRLRFIEIFCLKKDLLQNYGGNYLVLLDADKNQV